jgi:hypothetical protein
MGQVVYMSVHAQQCCVPLGSVVLAIRLAKTLQKALRHHEYPYMSDTRRGLQSAASVLCCKTDAHAARVHIRALRVTAKLQSTATWAKRDFRGKIYQRVEASAPAHDQDLASATGSRCQTSSVSIIYRHDNHTQLKKASRRLLSLEHSTIIM